MAFESIKPTKIPDAIVAQVEQLILQGILKPGDKLPPERELAIELEVSRPSLREALLKLEAKGLLQTRRGGGTFVTDIVAPLLGDPLVHLLKDHPETAHDVLELGHGLEEIAAYFAAIRCTETDREILQHQFSELKTTHKEMDPLLDAQADVEFHLAVADASHNVVLIHVMRGLFNLLRTTMTTHREKLYTQKGNFEIVYKQHEDILNAILQKDPDAAREAAHLHLSFIEVSLRELSAESVREQTSQRRLQSLMGSD